MGRLWDEVKSHIITQSKADRTSPPHARVGFEIVAYYYRDDADAQLVGIEESERKDWDEAQWRAYFITKLRYIALHRHGSVLLKGCCTEWKKDMGYVVFVLAVCVIKVFKDGEALEGARERSRAIRAE